MDKDVVGRYREGLSKPGEGDTAEYHQGDCWEGHKSITGSLLASLPQPEKIKTSTVVLVRRLLSHTFLASLHFKIRVGVSLVSGAEEKETALTHLHSKLPAEADLSWRKEDETEWSSGILLLHWTRHFNYWTKTLWRNQVTREDKILFNNCEHINWVLPMILFGSRGTCNCRVQAVKGKYKLVFWLHHTFSLMS